MARRNLVETRDQQGAFTAAGAAAGDLLYVWDLSAVGVAQSRSMPMIELQRYVNLGDVQQGGATPTTRSDTSVLVAGDRWWDSTRLAWFRWNGTAWLSEQRFEVAIALDADISASVQRVVLPVNGSIWVESLSGSIKPAIDTYDATDYWTIAAMDLDAADSATTIASWDLDDSAGGNREPFSVAIGEVIAADAIAIAFTKTASPGNLLAGTTVKVVCRQIG